MLKVALDKLAHLVHHTRLSKGDASVRAQGIEEIRALLIPTLKERGALCLRIHPQHISLGDAVVYEQPNRAESLAFRLFREGVESLTFEPGVSAEELEALIEALAIPRELAEQLGQDLVTRLWIKPLRGVWVTERPWHALQMLEPHNQEPDLLRAYVADAMVFLTPPRGARGEVLGEDANEATAGWFQLARRGGDLSPRSPVMTGVFEPLQPETDTQAALAEVTRLLLTAAQATQDALPGAALEELLLGLTRSLMLLGQEDTLEQLYQDLGALARRGGARGEQARRVMIRGASVVSMQQLLLGNASQAAARDDAWVPGFFARHSHNTPQEYYPLFALNLTHDALQTLLRALWTVGGPSGEVWLPLLDQAPVEIAHEILRFLQTQGQEHEALLQAIYRRALSHRSPQVRLTAVERAPLHAGASLHPALVAGLQDDDAEVRVATLRRLGQSGDPQVGIFLVDQLRRDYFCAASEREQRALLEGLLSLGQERYLPLLLGQLDYLLLQRARLAPEDLHRTCEVLLEALGRTQSHAAWSALQQRQPPEALALAWQRALEALELHLQRQPPTPRPTLHTLPSLDEGPLESAEPLRAVQQELESFGGGTNLDALLNAYVFDDTATMRVLAYDSDPHTPASGEPWEPTQIPEMINLETLLRDYLGSSAESLLEELSSPQEPAPNLPPSSPSGDSVMEIFVSSPLLSAAWPASAALQLDEVNPGSELLSGITPDTLLAPHLGTLDEGQGDWDDLSSLPSEDPLGGFEDGHNSGAAALHGLLIEDERQWLEHFSDPDLDHEIDALIDDLIEHPSDEDEPPPGPGT